MAPENEKKKLGEVNECVILWTPFNCSLSVGFQKIEMSKKRINNSTFKQNQLASWEYLPRPYF